MFKKMFKKIAVVACVASLALGTVAVANAKEYNAEFGAFFNDPSDADDDDGGWPNLGDAAKTTFTDDGKVATITIEFTEERSFEGHYAAVNTNFPYDEEDLPDAKITSIKLDGKEYALTNDTFLNNEGIDGGLRLTICNAWNDKIAKQPLDLSTIADVKFKKLEVSFSVNAAGAAAESSSSSAAATGSTDSATPTGDSTMVGVLAVVALKPEEYFLKNIEKEELLSKLGEFFALKAAKS